MLEILKYPDPRLKQKSVSVTTFDATLHKLLDDMVETMYGANGVGLAAPQVGDFRRIFVIDVSSAEDNEPRRIHEFINPRILSGEGKTSYEEGCLSVPGVTELVSRKNKVRVEFQDRNGQPQTIEAEGLLSVAIQHENDHLEGVLFIDKLSALKRGLIKKKLARAAIL